MSATVKIYPLDYIREILSVQFYGPFSISCCLGVFHYTVYWCFNDVLPCVHGCVNSIMRYIHWDCLCVCVCLSSVHGGVRPRPLRVSRHVPVRAWVGGTGLLQWWVHLTPKPAFSQAKFVPKWPSKPVRLDELAEKHSTVLTCAPVSKLLRFVSSLLSKHSQRNR